MGKISKVQFVSNTKVMSKYNCQKFLKKTIAHEGGREGGWERERDSVSSFV